MQVKQLAKASLGKGVKAAAAAVDRVRPPASGITFLIYHRVGGRSPSNVDLPTEQFDRQVAELAASGRLLSIDDAVRLLSSKEPIADQNPVVLTFDDGTADWVDEVLPVLVRHAAPATFYVATDFVERRLEFPDGGRPVSWAGLAEMFGTGLVTVGSHTHSHALLDRAGAALASDELQRSSDLIGEHLGVFARHFAYPKALVGSPEAEAEVRARFTTAAIGGGTANVPGEHNLHRLTRSAIQNSDGTRWFRRKAAGGLSFEQQARAALNRRRYAGAST